MGRDSEDKEGVGQGSEEKMNRRKVEIKMM